jgi:2'-hydroxyisoflavone reductase
VQFVDARDLAAWYIKMIEGGHTGVYNATGPQAPLSIAELLYGIRAVTSTPLSFTWVEAGFLDKHEVQAWTQMTVWVPPTEDEQGFARMDCSRAISKGLTFRPLADTARDTLEWWKTLPEERRAKPRAGLSPKREAAVLGAWHAREKPATPAAGDPEP